MIAKLKGLLDSRGDGEAVIDVSGVGYLVFASARTLGRLPQVGQACALVIETHVREDHIHLYGFIDDAERDWFRILLSVQGVGAKVALSILSTLAPDKLAQAIAAQDKAALTRAGGVGPKLGQRIVSELKDKVGGLALGAAVRQAEKATGKGGQEADHSSEAVSALVNLGYGPSEAFAAVARIAGESGGGGTESLIKAALQELGRERSGGGR